MPVFTIHVTLFSKEVIPVDCTDEDPEHIHKSIADQCEINLKMFKTPEGPWFEGLHVTLEKSAYSQLTELGVPVTWDCLSTTNSPTTVKLLLEAGVNINDRDDHGSALIHALNDNHLDSAMTLLEAEADVNIENKQGKTALYMAARNKCTAFIQPIIDAGADIHHECMGGQTALFLSGFSQKADCGKILLKNGADPNKSVNDGRAPLHIASVNKNLELVQALIDAGADVDILDGNFITPLIMAAEVGSTEIVEVLLKADAKVNLKDSAGYTALKIAKNNGNIEIIYLLLEYGAE